MNQTITVGRGSDHPIRFVVTIQALEPADLHSQKGTDPALKVVNSIEQPSVHRELMTDNQRQLIRRLLPKRFRDPSLRDLEMERIKGFRKADASKYITSLLQA